MIFRADKLKRLLDCFRRRIPVQRHRDQQSSIERLEDTMDLLVSDDDPNCPSSTATHDRLGHLLDTARHRGREHAFPELRMRASSQDLVRLLDKIQLEKFICFVQNQMSHAVAE